MAILLADQTPAPESASLIDKLLRYGGVAGLIAVVLVLCAGGSGAQATRIQSSGTLPTTCFAESNNATHPSVVRLVSWKEN